MPLPRLSDRQADVHRGALALTTGQLETTAVPLDRLLDQCQPETGARSGLALGVGRAEELLEQLVLLLGRNADASATSVSCSLSYRSRRVGGSLGTATYRVYGRRFA